MVDATDSKSVILMDVLVQILPEAPLIIKLYLHNINFNFGTKVLTKLKIYLLCYIFNNKLVNNLFRLVSGKLNVLTIKIYQYL